MVKIKNPSMKISLLPPPVPQRMREILKDYPDLIERVQEVLDAYVEKPYNLMPFEGAIWALEGRLESFISEAREELEKAQASGDPGAIRYAEEKERATRHASSKNRGMSDLNEIWDYMEAHKESLI
ncbi:hypothetical protein VC279_13910 [Xanthomonas sp. WHRI 10064A]|uniref:hypothetical protein n=1 Tax=unclassified Xanthomonas TaxID=2643310 RepID=UPI002B22EF17|nr:MULTISPECIES: hypothetical protein [unclassified Xanthomonas]MEA9588045.1 hypothetical protein [Xanthomonas sp. WHRI 10064B]MEA9615767.1 hypothetical protein [Xanthomonas sp. WHRI 10064A]